MNYHVRYWLHTVGRYWFPIFIAALVLWSVWNDTSSSSSATAPLPAPAASASTVDANATARAALENAVAQKTTPHSLSNGTVIQRDTSYLYGNGELEITNGTDEDAVAKLIRDGKSILTVYVGSRKSYTMTSISDGTYWLAFAQGIDWDTMSERFKTSVSYSAFDETFDFATTEDDYSYYYPRFEVTLHPVVGGTAETSNVDPALFNAY